MLLNNNILLKANDHIAVPNQVTSRTGSFLPFTVGTNDWQGRARPFKNALGEWGLCWIEGTQHSAGTAADQRFNIAFSNDEGTTWTDNNEYIGGGAVGNFPLGVVAAGASFVNECQVILCPNGDLVLIAFERSSSYTTVTHSQWRSTDNGENWTFDLDFVDAVGISDNTKVQACYEHMIVGSRIYVIFMEIRTDLDDTRMRLFKSDDNCATWDFVSNPVEYDEADPDCTESSIAHLGGTRFACIFRTQNLGNAVSKTSEDNGVTWGPLTEFSDNLGYVGVHQPRVKQYSNFFILMGRDMKQRIGDPEFIVHNRTAYWTTTDLFATPAVRRYLDPFYSGNGDISDSLLLGDSGYGSALEKADGSFMFFGYFGSHGSSRIFKYDVSHTNTPSNEHYSNTEFFPQTISNNGWRLQLNRDNFFEPAGATPALGGIAVISRPHNTLLTGSLYWTASGTNRPEFDVTNNRGEAIFDGSARIQSVTSIGNALYRNSFSLGGWFQPADGQPAGTQALIRDCSSTSTTTDGTTDRVQFLLQTDGKIQLSYMINGSNVSLVSNAVVFPNGATLMTHLAATFESGGLIRLYVNGVADANTADMSALTMANYTTTLQTHIGQRQTGASSWDLGFVGRMREVMCQPGLWDATDIANIMLN